MAPETKRAELSKEPPLPYAFRTIPGGAVCAVAGQSLARPLVRRRRLASFRSKCSPVGSHASLDTRRVARPRVTDHAPCAATTLLSPPSLL